MPAKQLVTYEDRLIQFLKKSYLVLSAAKQDDHARALRKINHSFQSDLMSGPSDEVSLIEQSLLKLRNDFLEWQVVFPELHRVQLMQALTERYTDVTLVKDIMTDNELNEWVTIKALDITSRLVFILNLVTQAFNSKMMRYQPGRHDLHLVIKQERTIKELYCPLVHRVIYQSYIVKIHDPAYDLDRAIQQTPKSLNRIIQDLNELKYQLSLYIHARNILKLKLRLNQDIYDLVDTLFESSALHHYPFAIQTIGKFYSMWVESNALNDHFPEVVAFVCSMLASCIMYTLSMQLAWITHYAQPMAFGFTLISIFVGIEVASPLFLFANSFFKFSNKNNRRYLLRRKPCHL